MLEGVGLPGPEPVGGQELGVPKGEGAWALLSGCARAGVGVAHSQGASVDVSEHTCGMCVGARAWPLSQPYIPPERHG